MTATRIQSAAALVAAVHGDTEDLATDRGALLWACCYPTAFDSPAPLADARAHDHRDTRVAVEALSALVEQRWSRLLFSVAASSILWDALRSDSAIAWLVVCALSSASALRVYEAITEGA